MKFLQNADRNRLGLIAIFLLILLFFAVNIFSNATFKATKIDLTEDKLFTVSDGTRQVLESIEEPITVRLYYSKSLGERSPGYATYYNRVHELLEQYADIADGKLILETYNPEPFTDEEDRAVSFGLRGVPVNSANDLGYFGLAATNSTDDQEVVPFFVRDRETFIEYDLTKLVYSLATPKKPVIGVMTGLPVMGNPNPQFAQPQWGFIARIRDFFTVFSVPTDSQEIPVDVDILLIAHPRNLDAKVQYAIDQFVMKGGRVLALVDSNAEIAPLAAPPMGMGQAPQPDASDLETLLKAWGVELVDNKIAADRKGARRVSMGGQGLPRPIVTDYVAWISAKPANMDPEDVVTGQLKEINFATPGALKKLDGATTEVQPLIETSTDSMLIDSSMARPTPQVLEMLNGFSPSGEKLMLAARITGPAESAFPKGPDGDAEAPPAGHIAKADNIRVIVVSDVDMLYDQFWSENQNFLGQQVSVPFADNANFVVNALDSLSGSEALIGLRARGNSDRPFTVVEELQRAAEVQYRATEKELVRKLQDAENSLDDLLKRGGGDAAQIEAVLSDEQKRQIEQTRVEMLELRRELRDVQGALRKDIDKLDATLKFLDIWLMPLLVIIALLIVTFLRYRRRSVTMRAS
ncbi:MAG: Gldg family protein [Rhodospirillales bacterium]